MKKKYCYYDPNLYMTDDGYLIRIYYYNGKKYNLVRMYVDKDYKKVLEKARDYCNSLTNLQK